MTIAKRITLAVLAALAVVVLAFAAVFSASLSAPANAAAETEVTEAIIAEKNLPLKFSVKVENGIVSGEPGGSYATVARTDYVDFEIVPEDIHNAGNVKYDYLVSDSSEPEGAWSEIVDPDRRFQYTNPNIGYSCHKFIHFRSRVDLSEGNTVVTYVYTSQRYVDLRFLAKPEDFEITGVTATTASGIYDISSAAVFTASDIRFSVSFDISNDATDNVLFNYCFIGDDGEREWKNVVGGSVEKVDGNYSFDFEISPDFFGADEVKAVASRIAFRATTVTGEELGSTYGESEEIWVRYDAEEPRFAIESDGVPSGNYNKRAVTYYLTPDDDCLSDVVYYYSLDGDPDNRVRIEAGSKGDYSVEVSETSLNLTFYAISAAGATYTVESRVLIDPVTPNIGVSATDRENREIINGGSARDFITFTVVNNAANTSTVRYLYSTDGVEYRPLERDPVNGVYTYYVTVISSAANSFFEGTYYFRLESAAGLSSEVVVFDFTVESNVFDFRMKELDFTTDGAGWVSSADDDGLRHSRIFKNGYGQIQISV